MYFYSVFFKKHNLNFEILSDTELKLARAFKNVTETMEDKVENVLYPGCELGYIGK